ncbi:MAG: hypothetical protein H0X62_12015 [Bacteroidetes bacterium]|nr:hypothetical protein [Bacteroidota bacterium]
MITLFSAQINAQVLCRSKKVIPVVSFNQCNDTPWELYFEDNFNGNALDTSKWEIITGVPRDPEFKVAKSWSQRENIRVENGSLKIIAKRETLLNMNFVADWGNPVYSTGDFEFTTGEIWTKEKNSVMENMKPG